MNKIILFVPLLLLPICAIPETQMHIVGDAEKNIKISEGTRITFSVDEGEMYVSQGDTMEVFTLDEVKLLKFAFGGETNLRFVEGESGERCWIDGEGNIRFSGVETEGKDVVVYSAEGKAVRKRGQKGVYFVRLGDMVFKVLRK